MPFLCSATIRPPGQMSGKRGSWAAQHLPRPAGCIPAEQERGSPQSLISFYPKTFDCNFFLLTGCIFKIKNENTVTKPLFKVIIFHVMPSTVSNHSYVYIISKTSKIVMGEPFLKYMISHIVAFNLQYCKIWITISIANRRLCWCMVQKKTNSSRIYHQVKIY